MADSEQLYEQTFTVGDEGKIVVGSLGTQNLDRFLEVSPSIETPWVVEGPGSVTVSVKTKPRSEMEVLGNSIYHQNLTVHVTRPHSEIGFCTTVQEVRFTRYVPALEEMTDSIHVPFALPNVTRAKRLFFFAGQSRATVTLDIDAPSGFNTGLGGSGGTFDAIFRAPADAANGNVTYNARVVTPNGVEIPGSEIRFEGTIGNKKDVYFDIDSLARSLHAAAVEPKPDLDQFDAAAEDLVNRVLAFQNGVIGFRVNRTLSRSEADIIVEVPDKMPCGGESFGQTSFHTSADGMQKVLDAWNADQFDGHAKLEAASFYLNQHLNTLRDDPKNAVITSHIYPANILREAARLNSGTVWPNGNLTPRAALTKVIAHELGHAQFFEGHILEPPISEFFVRPDMMKQGLESAWQSDTEHSRDYLMIAQGDSYTFDDLEDALSLLTPSPKFPEFASVHSVAEALSAGSHSAEPEWCETNPYSNLDANADGNVSAIDALTIINELARGGARDLSTGSERTTSNYVDTNGDQKVSPLDALVVINQLARDEAFRQGEQEFHSATADSNRDDVLTHWSLPLDTDTFSDDDDFELIADSRLF